MSRAVTCPFASAHDPRATGWAPDRPHPSGARPPRPTLLWRPIRGLAAQVSCSWCGSASRLDGRGTWKEPSLCRSFSATVGPRPSDVV